MHMLFMIYIQVHRTVMQAILHGLKKEQYWLLVLECILQSSPKISNGLNSELGRASC